MIVAEDEEMKKVWASLIVSLHESSAQYAGQCMYDLFSY